MLISNSDRIVDLGMEIIVSHHLELFRTQIINPSYGIVDDQLCGLLERSTSQLLLYQFDLISVDMAIATNPNQTLSSHANQLGHQMSQERVLTDVERASNCRVLRLIIQRESLVLFLLDDFVT